MRRLLVTVCNLGLRSVSTINVILFLQSVVDLEKAMLSRDVSIPVYFLLWEKELQNVISNVDILTATNEVKSDRKETATDGKPSEAEDDAFA